MKPTGRTRTPARAEPSAGSAFEATSRRQVRRCTNGSSPGGIEPRQVRQLHLKKAPSVSALRKPRPTPFRRSDGQNCNVGADGVGAVYEPDFLNCIVRRFRPGLGAHRALQSTAAPLMEFHGGCPRDRPTKTSSSVEAALRSFLDRHGCKTSDTPPIGKWLNADLRDGGGRVELSAAGHPARGCDFPDAEQRLSARGVGPRFEHEPKPRLRGPAPGADAATRAPVRAEDDARRPLPVLPNGGERGLRLHPPTSQRTVGGVLQSCLTSHRGVTPNASAAS